MRRFRWPLIVLAIGVALFATRLGWPYFHWLAFGVKTEMTNFDDFLVSGVVVDENDTPTDVRVKVQKSWKRKMGFSNEYRSTYESVNGNFTFRLNNCDGVRLFFLKRGYEVGELSFQAEGEYTNQRIVMKRKAATTTSTKKKSSE